jgi:hypothetical protein
MLTFEETVDRLFCRIENVDLCINLGGKFIIGLIC